MLHSSLLHAFQSFWYSFRHEKWINLLWCLKYFDIVSIFFKSKLFNTVIILFSLILSFHSYWYITHCLPFYWFCNCKWHIFPFQEPKFRCRCSSEPRYTSPRWVRPFPKLNHCIILRCFAFVWLFSLKLD